MYPWCFLPKVSGKEEDLEATILRLQKLFMNFHISSELSAQIELLHFLHFCIFYSLHFNSDGIAASAPAEELKSSR